MHTSEMLEHRGRSLCYLDQGEGRLLLLIHAFPLHAGMWSPQLRARPGGWRILAPDLSGFNRSPRSAAEPVRDVAGHAADVLHLVARAGGGAPAVIVGLSMGGYIAFECWRQRPDLVRGLVFADTRAEADTDEARQKRVAMQAQARESGVAAVADAMVPGLLGATTFRRKRARPCWMWWRGFSRTSIRHCHTGSPVVSACAAPVP